VRDERRRRIRENGKPEAWDVAADFARFVRAYPEWCRDGKPRSWEHFVLGLREIEREETRASLRIARATRVGASRDEDFRSWVRECEGDLRG
jgi:hypothetical protein